MTEPELAEPLIAETLDPLDPRSIRSRSSPTQRLAEQPTAVYMAVLLVLLIGTFSLLSPNNIFLQMTTAQDVLINVATTMPLAVGMAVLLAAGLLDLSVGPIVGFASVVSAKVMLGLANGGSMPLASIIVIGIVTAIATGAAFGLLNAVVVAFGRVNSFIATLATGGIGLGVTFVLTDGVDVSGLPRALQSLGSQQFVLPLPTIVSLAVCLIVALFMYFLPFGVHTLAMGSSPTAAERSGLNLRLSTIRLFLLNGALAGLVGFIVLTRFGTTNIGGTGDDALAAITAAVLGGASLFGGRASIIGAIVAALIPAVLDTGLVIQGVSPYYQYITVGAILVTAVTIDARRTQR